MARPAAPAPQGTPIDRLLRTAVQRLSRMPEPQVTLEEVAAEAGVPLDVARSLFRSSDELMQTVAETAMRLQMDSLTRAVMAQPGDDPVAQFLALGHAFLDWALTNRDQFRLLQSPLMQRAMGGERMEAYNKSVRDLAASMLARAQDAGRLPAGADIDGLLLSSRALTYGLARLELDDQVGAWGDMSGDAAQLHRALDLMAASIFGPPGGSR